MTRDEIADSLIDGIHLHSANLEHIMKRGKINGGLRSELKGLITKVRKDALRDASEAIGFEPTIAMAQEKIKSLML